MVMKSEKKTSASIYSEDLKWLHKRKIDQDDESLAETFRKLRKTVEKSEDEEK